MDQSPANQRALVTTLGGFVFIGALLLAALAKWSTGSALSRTAAAERAGESEPVNFARQIMPLLDQHCLPCHNETGDGFLQSNFRADSYTAITHKATFVTPGDASTSRLLMRLQLKTDLIENDPHLVLSTDEIQRIRDWLNQGAREGVDSE